LIVQYLASQITSVHTA